MMYMPSVFGENLMDDFFDDDFFRTPARKSTSGLMRTDIKKLDGSYELSIELPGVKKENVELSLDNGYLKIQANSTNEKEEKDDDGQWIRRERYSGTSERTFYVGEQVTEDDVKASFENGILKITVPDEEEQKKRLPEKKVIQII